MARPDSRDDNPPWPAAWEPVPTTDTASGTAYDWQAPHYDRMAGDPPLQRQRVPVVFKGPFVFLGSVAFGVWGIAFGAVAIVAAFDPHPKGRYDTIAAPAIFGPIALFLLWLAIRSTRVRVTADGIGLQIDNIFSSKTVPWTGVKACSTVYCRSGTRSSWRVIIAHRDGHNVPARALIYPCWIRSSAAKAKAEASIARLRSLAPPGTAWDIGDSTAASRQWDSRQWDRRHP